MLISCPCPLSHMLAYHNEQIIILMKIFDISFATKNCFLITFL